MFPTCILPQASEICNETGDRAGCYHLARQLENQDHIKEAIHFFQRAEAYGNAIRLCKVGHFIDLWQSPSINEPGSEKIALNSNVDIAYKNLLM